MDKRRQHEIGSKILSRVSTNVYESTPGNISSRHGMYDIAVRGANLIILQVRNMYMHRFGGVYADLDLIPLSSITEHLPIFDSTIPPPMRIAYVGRMSKESFEHSIPNAFMASTSSGHQFWLRPLAFVQENISVWKYNRQPEALTGPVALRQCVNEWQDQSDTRNGAGQYDEVRVIEGGKVRLVSTLWMQTNLLNRSIHSLGMILLCLRR